MNMAGLDFKASMRCNCKKSLYCPCAFQLFTFTPNAFTRRAICRHAICGSITLQVAHVNLRARIDLVRARARVTAQGWREQQSRRDQQGELFPQRADGLLMADEERPTPAGPPVFQSNGELEHDSENACPRLDRGGNRFSEKIILKQKVRL
jgi:hypothetical protein